MIVKKLIVKGNRRPLSESKGKPRKKPFLFEIDGRQEFPEKAKYARHKNRRHQKPEEYLEYSAGSLAFLSARHLPVENHPEFVFLFFHDAFI